MTSPNSPKAPPIRPGSKPSFSPHDHAGPTGEQEQTPPASTPFAAGAKVPAPPELADPPPEAAPRPTGDRGQVPLTPPASLPAGAHPFSPLASSPTVEQIAPPAAPNVPPRPRPGQPTVRVTIDGAPIDVAKDTNVLEAAKLAGKDICHFCYHPGLSIAASCRQCLVEIEKSPKLVPSCQAIVQDGMVVQTESPRVLEARRQMLEFTLINHPIDCPICDKAGECILQRHYMDHDHQLTRVDVPKVRKAKAKDIGREIVLDQERCILCSRCVRFCEEIPETAELGMMDRGDREVLDIAPGRRLDNAYSINVVDICPVGALTSKDFRFKIRTWELQASSSTCNGCATGCATELHHRDEQAHRLVPRFDPDVNSYWMCDAGRYTYKELEPNIRIRHATVDGEMRPLDDAIAEAAKGLQGRKTAIVFSATATNEANLALAELARGLRGSRFVLGRPRGEGDDLLIDTDKNPNSRGAYKAAGAVDKHEDELALELAGGAYEAVVFLDGTGRLSDVALQGLGSITSICLADHRTPITDACRIVLPAASWAEIVGSYFNRQDRLRVVQPAWRPEGERRHRAELLRRLQVAIGEEDSIRSPRDLSRKLAEQAKNTELLALTEEQVERRPTLLRWAHTRG